MTIEVIILAAGKGTRMRSTLPKVLHPLAGKPLLNHVLDTANCLSPNRIHVVYGYGGDTVPNTIGNNSINWVFQEQQQGTGHAVRLAIPHVDDDAVVLVMYGDIPLISSVTMAELIATATRSQTLAVLTMQTDDAGAYGRIIRDSEGNVTGIVEAKDATREQLAIGEFNTGFMAAPAKLMNGWLQGLSNKNAQGEYYLTDIVAAAVAEGRNVVTTSAENAYEVEGVNSKQELAALERLHQIENAHRLMDHGVCFADPNRFDLRGTLDAGEDCYFDINLIIEGNNRFGQGVSIGPNCVIKNAVIGDNVTIHANSVVEDAEIHDHCNVGPFARIRPGTVLKQGARIGNFVETKNAQIGPGSKANHLAYVGDAEVGSNSNIGAGVITCNYDGANKHKTTIGDDVFVGSDSQLIAPVTIEDGATIGAGTTLSSTAPSNQLTVGRAKARTIRNWVRPTKGGNH